MGLALLAVAGCISGPNYPVLVARLEQTVKDRDQQLANQKAAIDELNRQLAVARGIKEEDLKKIFYPETLVIDSLSGGEHYEGGPPGDNGVTVYLKPLDRYGDVIKAAGDIRIQLYDLANPVGENLIGEYSFPVDQVASLWFGKLLVYHYTLKCPWQHGPPKHPEITIRATFVDYLTRRVMTAQAVCTVKLPPSESAP